MHAAPVAVCRVTIRAAHRRYIQPNISKRKRYAMDRLKNIG
jgi:hypothetical protein